MTVPGGGAWAAENAASAKEVAILKPRVPVEQLAKARATKNPLVINADALAHGGSIYRGKGTCIGCHGAKGMGDGDLGVVFDPPPRNFRNSGWQSARTDGEIFWAIKFGTYQGMEPFGGLLSEEEIWALVAYVRSFGK